jgi:hypothetical protein
MSDFVALILAVAAVSFGASLITSFLVTRLLLNITNRKD